MSTASGEERVKHGQLHTLTEKWHPLLTFHWPKQVTRSYLTLEGRASFHKNLQNFSNAIAELVMVMLNFVDSKMYFFFFHFSISKYYWDSLNNQYHFIITISHSFKFYLWNQNAFHNWWYLRFDDDMLLLQFFPDAWLSMIWRDRDWDGVCNPHMLGSVPVILWALGKTFLSDFLTFLVLFV